MFYRIKSILSLKIISPFLILIVQKPIGKFSMSIVENRVANSYFKTISPKVLYISKVVRVLVGSSICITLLAGLG
ncbi:hypothetical protein FLAV_00734 [Flavobacteriales bacterium]|nr:hypothetical protein FLAV_00734 [Flavobacteriales bacterium]